MAGARRPRKKKEVEETSFMAEEPERVDPDKDLETDENKAQWLKRRSDEDKVIKSRREKSDSEWYEVHGKKLIRCRRKKDAGLFRQYVCNLKKHPLKVEELKSKGFEVKGA